MATCCCVAVSLSAVWLSLWLVSGCVCFVNIFLHAVWLPILLQCDWLTNACLNTYQALRLPNLLIIAPGLLFCDCQTNDHVALWRRLLCDYLSNRCEQSFWLMKEASLDLIVMRWWREHHLVSKWWNDKGSLTGSVWDKVTKVASLGR